MKRNTLCKASLGACTLLFSCTETPKPSTASAPSSIAVAVPAPLPPSNGASGGLTKLAPVPQYNLELMGRIISPLLVKDLTVPREMTMNIQGWAVDSVNRTAGKSVDLVIDGNFYATTYNVERTDVSRVLKNRAYQHSGFAITIEAGKIPPGKHKLSVRVVTKDGKSYLETPPFEFTVR